MNGSINWNEVCESALARDRARREAKQAEAKQAEVKAEPVDVVFDAQSFVHEGKIGYAINRHDGKGWLYPHRPVPDGKELMLFDDWDSVFTHVEHMNPDVTVLWVNNTSAEVEMFSLMARLQDLARVKREMGF